MAEPPVTPEGSLERILILGIRQSDGKTIAERQKSAYGCDSVGEDNRRIPSFIESTAMSLAEMLVAPQLRNLTPYQSARRIGGQGQVYLNANESAFPPFGMPEGESWHRYPDFLPTELAATYADYAGVSPEQTLAVRGADEAIDLLIRTYCMPRVDGIRVQNPTYSMYEFVADAHQVAIDSIDLDERFDIDLAANCSPKLPDASPIKLVFICNPNNPTGNLLSRDRLLAIVDAHRDRTLVVIDEAYIEYCPEQSLVDFLDDYPNLVIIRTLSKAFALAAIRVGFLIASPDILRPIHTLVPPYPMPDDSARIAIDALSYAGIKHMQSTRNRVYRLRDNAVASLQRCPCVHSVLASETNFLLVRFHNARRVMQHLADQGIILRDQTHHARLSQHLRISVGNDSDMALLIAALQHVS